MLDSWIAGCWIQDAGCGSEPERSAGMPREVWRGRRERVVRYHGWCSRAWMPSPSRARRRSTIAWRASGKPSRPSMIALRTAHPEGTRLRVGERVELRLGSDAAVELGQELELGVDASRGLDQQAARGPEGAPR